jgi:hypothetical protein
MSKKKSILVLLLILCLCISQVAAISLINFDSKDVKENIEHSEHNINNTENKNHTYYVMNKIQSEIKGLKVLVTEPLNMTINDSNSTNNSTSVVEENNTTETLHNYKTFYGFPSSWQDGDREYCLYAVTYDWDLALSYYGPLTWYPSKSGVPEGEFTTDTGLDISVFGREKSQSSYSFLNPHNQLVNAIVSIEKVR